MHQVPRRGYRHLVSLTDADVAALLASAGLQFVDRVHGDVPDPLPPGRSAGTCRAEHGRFDSRPDEVADVDDPDMPAKVNAGWHRMAVEHGLFDDAGEFLINVDYCGREYRWADDDEDDPPVDDLECEWHWVRVRLMDDWDIAASGVPQLRSALATTFTRRYVPEFTTLSVDGRTLLDVTVWGNGTVSTIAIRS